MWEISVPLAVAGGVYDGVFLFSPFPLRSLDGILDLIESVSEGFSTYSCNILWITSCVLLFKRFMTVCQIQLSFAV